MKRIYFVLLILQSSLGHVSFEREQVLRLDQCSEYESIISAAVKTTDIDEILSACDGDIGLDEACTMLAEQCGY